MEETGFNEFLGKFGFKKSGQGLIGIERERFLTDRGMLPVPRAEEFLAIVKDPRWTCELSSCQVEDRTEPKKRISDVEKELLLNDRMGNYVAGEMGLILYCMEVGPEDMPLDIFPKPRYLEIAENISLETLKAGCRVTGTHIHLGMPDIKTAIKASNAFREYIPYLCEIGNNSHGERLRLYKKMAPDWNPPVYEDKQHFFETAKEKGFAKDPRKCWHLIRISVHGTLELRMFGSTSRTRKTIEWVKTAREILESIF
jgi:gamma-glutamyl:cysteine ligase YbdK (ATP-grasp superfamily)